MSEIDGPHIEGMSPESLEKFIEGMRIVDVAFYGDPQAVHLFLASRSTVGRITALLTITACDDILSINLEGTSEPEPDRAPPQWSMPGSLGDY